MDSISNRPNYIDIHSHINFSEFDKDRDEVIQRTKDAKTWMINVGTGAETSSQVAELADKNEGMYAIIGLHPIYTTEESFDPEFYRKLLQHPKVVGIGECGLDFFHIKGKEVVDGKEVYTDEYKVARKRQEDAFRGQIELAIEFKKPIMIHARESYKDILLILDEYLNKPDAELRGNVHFFAGTLEEAEEFLKRGFTLSFTGVITFAKQYEELVKFVPLDRIMSETDCPYVAPVPHRGKRNEPVFVMEVAKKIAEIKGESLEKVQKALVNNAFRVFGL